MSHIPHTRRAKGRYVFQRRVHYRNLISKPVPLVQGIADPKVARTRAATLSARFVLMKSGVDAMPEDECAMTEPEIKALFRAELEAELTWCVYSAYENASWSSSVPQVAAQEAEAYRIIRRPDRITAASIASSADSLFQVHDARPFSKVVPDVLADLKAEGIWRGDLKQQRRIMETFAWIAGDKPLGQHMVTYIGATLPLPVNAAGKGPNIHSIRSQAIVQPDVWKLPRGMITHSGIPI